MSSSIKQVKSELRRLADPTKVKFLLRFFRTAPGEYGHGDKFLGLTVPQVRAVAKNHCDLALDRLQALLRSSYHEERQLALVVLVHQFNRSNTKRRKQLFYFYVRNRAFVNNWDLVDVSAPQILGSYLLEDESQKKVLYRLAIAPSLWDRRIAIVSTQAFIRKGKLKETLAIAEVLLQDEEDLIHKACGWMLRELGKKDQTKLLGFLNRHASVMPRTMLRYSLEKLSPSLRKKYMAKKKLD